MPEYREARNEGYSNSELHGLASVHLVHDDVWHLPGVDQEFQRRRAAETGLNRKLASSACSVKSNVAPMSATGPEDNYAALGLISFGLKALRG